MIRRGCDNDPQGMRCNNHSHTTYRKERSGKHWKHCRMRREEAEGQTKYKSEVCEHRGDANAFLATLGQASPGPDIGADASDTRPEHRHHSRPAMYLQCTRAAQGL